jgi:ergothioneine biosynthesis protein EgtB
VAVRSGRSPSATEGTVGAMTPTGSGSTPREDTARATRLRAAYASVRDTTETLASPLSAEDQTVQSMPDVSPTKWHRGHTSWFFETFLLLPKLHGYEEHHPMYGFLFNSYYEAAGQRHPRPERGLISRPGIEEVAAYRRHVDAAMHDLLGQLRTDETLDLVELGIHHEQQHQELLLMDIKHVLSKNPLLPAYRPRPAGSPQAQGASSDGRGARGTAALATSKIEWIEHPGGLVEVGHSGPGFAFDNESPRHSEVLVPFALATRPVTCGEWAEFAEDGGYARPELWLSEGWAAVQAHRWQAPLYWDLSESPPRVFTLEGPRPIDPAEPVVHVSYFEADAFARWAGARLPTEAEWEEVACDETSLQDPGGAAFGLHPSPVEAGGFFGTVWQWTSSSYGPYPGFRPAAGAVGEYNGKFMVNQQVLRGSACITPPGHARATYRNFFPAASRWAFSGVRLARDL